MEVPVALLSAKNLDVEVLGRTLVKQINLTFCAGDFIAILGQNGAGKTLTLQTLAGLRQYASGEVLLESAAIHSLNRRVVAKVLSLLPQESDDLFPATVFDTVLIGRHPHIAPLRLESRHDRDVAFRCLEKTGLDGLADRDVTTLSGGERRRLAIAQTLAQSPQVYLLDEPLNHLDPQHQLDVLDLFARKTRDGKTVIATLHDVNLARRYASRCLLLFGDGRWQLGPTEEVLSAESLSELFNVRMETVHWNGASVFVAAASRAPVMPDAAHSANDS